MTSMRMFTTAIAGMLVLATSWAARGADKAIEWRADYDAARKEAAEKGRPLFLEFQTEDCFHCRRLEAGPFRDQAVVGIVNERFIPLRVDPNKSPRLTEALRIQAYPTMIIAAADGKILAFLEGYQDARPLHDHLQRVADHVESLDALLSSALSANLAQVGVRQNEDMRKISAWVAIAAVPTMIAGIYGMNFEHMPELTASVDLGSGEFQYGYFLVLAVMATACIGLYRAFKRSGWL